MQNVERPESLEGRWDILYREYPEVYEEWGQIRHVPDFLQVVVGRFSLTAKRVVDVGSGTGISTLKLAERASFVIGIEAEETMIAVARQTAENHGVKNVRFELGDAEHLPLADSSVDAAIAITLAGGDIREVASEMERVVRPGGLVLRGDVAPGWYGGDVMRFVEGEPDETALPDSRDAVLAGLGYEALDVFMDQDYGTAERAVRTYGFIHSKRAIDHIREHNVTTIRWKARARFKNVDLSPSSA